VLLGLMMAVQRERRSWYGTDEQTGAGQDGAAEEHANAKSQDNVNAGIYTINTNPYQCVQAALIAYIRRNKSSHHVDLSGILQSSLTFSDPTMMPSQ